LSGFEQELGNMAGQLVFDIAFICFVFGQHYIKDEGVLQQLVGEIGLWFG
jgi:hypothetical protein